MKGSSKGEEGGNVQNVQGMDSLSFCDRVFKSGKRVREELERKLYEERKIV